MRRDEIGGSLASFAVAFPNRVPDAELPISTLGIGDDGCRTTLHSHLKVPPGGGFTADL